MAAPTIWEKSLQEVIKQGPTLREIQHGMTDLSSRVGDLGGGPPHVIGIQVKGI